MLLRDLIHTLEALFPLALQESYDNSGLLVGNPQQELTSALVSLDLTEQVLDEAIGRHCNLIISHHPFIFKPIKRLTGRNQVERLAMRAVKHDIALFALHTNLDNHAFGHNRWLGQLLGLEHIRILRPMDQQLIKLVTYCPPAQADRVRQTLFGAGGGHIGRYSHCSFNSNGFGTFLPGQGAQPFVGSIGKLHSEPEIRIEMVFANYQLQAGLEALKSSHPYEEVAYDIYPLANPNPTTGAGIIGELAEPVPALDFLETVKQKIGLACLRHNGAIRSDVSKVALCGGSGAFLIPDAMQQGADVYLTGDLKYHDFSMPEDRMLLADIGHYESEQFMKELVVNVLKEKFPTFALLKSDSDINPVKYL